MPPVFTPDADWLTAAPSRALLVKNGFRVVSGVPDHRDVILSDDEKATNKVMQICVSRAKSERLVLDL